jgi:hypothetical protein
MLFGQFREEWQRGNNEMGREFDRLLQDLRHTLAKDLEPDTSKYVSEIMLRVEQVKNTWGGCVVTTRSNLNDLESRVLVTLAEEK